MPHPLLCTAENNALAQMKWLCCLFGLLFAPDYAHCSGNATLTFIPPDYQDHYLVFTAVFIHLQQQFSSFLSNDAARRTDGDIVGQCHHTYRHV